MRLFKLYLKSEATKQRLLSVLRRAKPGIMAELSHLFKDEEADISLDSVYIEVTEDNMLRIIPVPSEEAEARELEAMDPDQVVAIMMQYTLSTKITIEHKEDEE